MPSDNNFKIDPLKFGVRRANRGYIYFIESGNLLKIGKTIKPSNRVYKEAMTWLPDAKILGAKPFWDYHEIERAYHCGLATYWYKGEWYKVDDEFREELVEDFLAFDDKDADSNSVNFIYMLNGFGMNEVTLEFSSRNQSLRSFLKENSSKEKK